MGAKILCFACSLFVGIATACGGSVRDPGSGGDPGGGGASSSAPAASGGSARDSGSGGDSGGGSASSTADGPCELLASSFDSSCTSDSDCVLAPPGGDTCDPCASAQTFWCATTIVNAKNAATYLARIEAVQDQMREVNASGRFCAASCPIEEGSLVCLKGQCTSTP
jgi:hypothetical protein